MSPSWVNTSRTCRKANLSDQNIIYMRLYCKLELHFKLPDMKYRHSPFSNKKLAKVETRNIFWMHQMQTLFLSNFGCWKRSQTCMGRVTCLAKTGSFSGVLRCHTFIKVFVHIFGMEWKRWPELQRRFFEEFMHFLDIIDSYQATQV